MLEFGATPISGGRYRFVAWAPTQPELTLIIEGDPRLVIPMQCRDGFHLADVTAIGGARYMFQLPDGRQLPDPASRHQPEGVHRASAVFDARHFRWTDQGFAGRSLRDTVIYEVHIGTFTGEGTLDSAIGRLDSLAELGITATEIMPVAQFPGERNWGYDGVYPFAVQNSYGGPIALQRFVDAAHARGLSVILDVVYNHLGPEGNYFGEFGPYFSGKYCTPWGQALNFDGPQCGPVRSFFIQNALHWFRDFHVDALRLDAVHGIYDFGARHFLAELQDRVEELAVATQRKLHLIAESDLNDSRMLRPPARGGYGMDSQWTDDVHHALHTLLTGESEGYYADFGKMEDLGIALRDGWRYSGEFSKFRQRRHGNSAAGISQNRFVVFSQNHDQIGNRARGERLTELVDFESLKLAAGVTLLSPFVPMLFMGEEYGETRPFQYFTSHGDPGLIEAVRNGRRAEFAQFGWSAGEIPDPQSDGTFTGSILDESAKDREPHRTMLRFYRSLLALRKRLKLGGAAADVTWDEATRILALVYATRGALAIFNFGSTEARVRLPNGIESAPEIFNSADPEWRGPTGGSLTIESQDGRVLVALRSFRVLVPHRGLTS